MDKVYDIIVIGGGISGAMAAIAAGRCGASVLIIEQTGFLGGTLTACGVGPMMTFHAGDKQVIKGLTDELIQRMVKKGKSCGHILDTTSYVKTVTPFDAEGMKLELEEMALESHVELLYHTFVGGVKKIKNKIESLTICNKAGISELKANIYVDATGDADVAYFAGVACTKGREGDEATQPMTLKMKFSNVDTKIIREYIQQHPDEFPRLHRDINIMNHTKCLSVVGFVKEFVAAKEKGEITIPREDVLFFETSNSGEIIVNTTRILGKDATNPWDLSLAEIEGRKQCAELEIFFKKYVPGFKEAHLEFTGPSVGVRGSRQIQGVYTLTADDMLNQKTFDDVIAHSGYPIDIHNPDGEGTNSIHMKLGDYYNLPYRIMLTKELSNLLVTGRCVSATFEAQAGIRTTPTVGALGHACGVAAALANDYHEDVRDINIQILQDVLKKQGAYIEI